MDRKTDRTNRAVLGFTASRTQLSRLSDSDLTQISTTPTSRSSRLHGGETFVYVIYLRKGGNHGMYEE
nr:hypothetical protein Iba_chr11fCG9450 [Ipomoea batatas]